MKKIVKPLKSIGYATGGVLSFAVLFLFIARSFVESPLLQKISGFLPFFFGAAGFAATFAACLFVCVHFGILTREHIGCAYRGVCSVGGKVPRWLIGVVIAGIAMLVFGTHIVSLPERGIDSFATSYNMDVRLAAICVTLVVMGVCLLFRGIRKPVIGFGIIGIILLGGLYLKQPNNFFDNMTGWPKIAFTQDDEIVHNVSYSDKETIASPLYDGTYGEPLKPPTNRGMIEPHVRDYTTPFSNMFEGVMMYFEKTSVYFKEKAEAFEPNFEPNKESQDGDVAAKRERKRKDILVRISEEKEQPVLRILHPHASTIAMRGDGLVIRWEARNLPECHVPAKTTLRWITPTPNRTWGGIHEQYPAEEGVHYAIWNVPSDFAKGESRIFVEIGVMCSSEWLYPPGDTVRRAIALR